MDIRQLHYFLVLCEEMNYTRAAQRLFLSRQALRQSISALEAELCGPLFLSAHHKLSLTDRGVSLQRHAAPVVEQFQQMQASLRAEIQSAQPVRIGISVSLVPDYLPGLETQLDKFRQQYPHIEMRFRLLENDAVADGVEQGELDAGLVMDLGTAAPVLARTTLRADPACLLVPRGHPLWEKERVPLSALRGQRVLLPSLRQDLFSPLWDACAREGFAPNAEIGPSFYQAYYLVQEQPADDVLHICMAGFRLGNTLSDNGSVTRGLCHITDGKLTGVTETHNIFKTADGAESREDGQPAEKLDLNELVSMNMWGLTPAFMDTLYDGFVEFLQNVKAGDIKAEYLLPVMIDTLIQKGTAKVDVLETKDTWFGVTYQEDKEVVIKAFKELTEAGVYPNGLYK